MLGDISQLILMSSATGGDDSLKAGKRHRKQLIHTKYLGEDSSKADA